MFESCSADFTRVIRSLAANVGDPWSALLVAGNIPTSTFGWKNFPQIGLKIDGEMVYHGNFDIDLVSKLSEL